MWHLQLLELNPVKTICFNNESECRVEDASAVRENSNDSVKEPVYSLSKGDFERTCKHQLCYDRAWI